MESGMQLSPNHGKQTKTQIVRLHLKVLWHGEDNAAGDSERSKKERTTEGWVEGGKVLLQRHLWCPDDFRG